MNNYLNKSSKLKEKEEIFFKNNEDDHKEEILDLDLNQKINISTKQIKYENIENELEMQNKNDIKSLKEKNNSENLSSESIKPEKKKNKFKIPKNLIKTFVCSIILTTIGIIFIIIGFISFLVKIGPSMGISFMCVGCITLLIGGYYVYHFYFAYKAKNKNQKNDIL